MYEHDFEVAAQEEVDENRRAIDQLGLKIEALSDKLDAIMEYLDIEIRESKFIIVEKKEKNKAVQNPMPNPTTLDNEPEFNMNEPTSKGFQVI